jgi:hypothetical protein
METIDSNKTYKLAEGLTIQGGYITAGLISAIRQYKNNLHKLKDVNDLTELLSPTIDRIISNVEGEHSDKKQILESFRLYLIKQAIS